MKPRITLRHFLVLAASSLMAVSSASAATYYWDGNDATLGFGAAGGTWADPTTGTATSGWSTDSTGATAVDGNSVITTTADSVNFGTNTALYGLAAGTITVSGTVNAGSITFGSQSGTIALSGGTINLAGVATITVNNTMVMSFTCLATADRGTATLMLEYDGDLAGTWLSVPVPGGVETPVEFTDSGSVSFVATDGGTNVNGGALINVVATISDGSQSASGKQFGRVKGVIP